MRKCRIFMSYLLPAVMLAGWTPLQAQSADPARDGSGEVFLGIRTNGQDNYMYLINCGPDCRIMRLHDPAQKSSMIIYVRASGGKIFATDHAKGQAVMVDFSVPSLADYTIGAKAYEESLLESMISLFTGSAGLTSTGNSKKFSLKHLGTFLSPNADPDLNLEVVANEYKFKFEYETDFLPLGQVPPEARAQMPDLKLHVTMEGTTWVAPDAPGKAEIALFYALMAKGLNQYTMAISGEGGEKANMTAAMTAAMAQIAAKGVPIQTKTKVKFELTMGALSAAMGGMPLDMLPMPGPTESESLVHVYAYRPNLYDGSGVFPEWVDPSWSERWIDSVGFLLSSPEGYDVVYK